MLPASFCQVPCALESVSLWSWSTQGIDLEFYKSLLSQEELRRTETMGQRKRRQEFICGRGGLRLLLGCYLERSPQELEIIYTPSGKPTLANSPWQFNLAHTDHLILCAIAEGSPVGVDVEHQGRSCSMDGIMRRYLSPQSYQAWQALPQAQQHREFWRWWTQREAIAKALGTGIYRQLTSHPPLQTATFVIYDHYLTSICLVEREF